MNDESVVLCVLWSRSRYAVVLLHADTRIVRRETIKPLGLAVGQDASHWRL
jgi:hypothetical protein